MCFGSEDRERTFRQGECRTTDDVGRLFERYRAEARHFAEALEPAVPAEPDLEPADEPVLTTR
jgi:hypothetical protein